MSLSSRQIAFTEAVGKLIAYAYANGYGLTFGDAYRDPRAFKGTMPYGAMYSNHKERRAVDFNVFYDGEYLTGLEAKDAHNELHDFWDSIGGNKRIPRDLNHYDWA
jgi:hypothetical protein